MKTPLNVLCAAALIVAATNVAARDRPGTPNQEKAYACGDWLTQAPAVCVDVNNTASEPVWFETEVTLNGAPVVPGALGGDAECNDRERRLTLEEQRRLPHTRTPGGGTIFYPPPPVLYRRCEAAQSLMPPVRQDPSDVLAIAKLKTGALDREHNQGVPPQGIRLRNVEPLSDYCFRFRTRRVSDHVVSAQWSNWACAQARALPARPDTPKDFSATFLPAQWSGSTGDKPQPHRVLLRWSPTARAASYVVLGQKFERGRAQYEEAIEVPADVIASGGQSVELCAHNISGRRCVTTLVARSYQPRDPMPERSKGSRDAIHAIEEAAQPKLRLPDAPATQALPAGSNDFNGDRFADIVWHNQDTQETQVWFMRGHARVGRATVTDGVTATHIGPPWRIAGSSDFSGDGNADLLWHNAATGETQLWFMSGARLASRATVVDESGRPFLVGAPWRIVCAQDMNGDGRADIVWHNGQTGAVQVWLMDRHRVAHRAAVTAESGNALALGTPPVAIHDMDADGSPDLVVRSGSVAQVLFMNGLKVARRAVLRAADGGSMAIGASWSITGANDFDRDGYGDLLLHDAASGQTRQWSMRGETVVRAQALDARLDGGGALVGLPWRQMNQ